MPPRGPLGSVRKRAGVPSDSLFSRRGRTEPPLSSARSCSHRAPSRTPHPEAQPHPAQCPEPPGSGPCYGTRAPGLSGLPALRNGTTARCQGSAQENARASLLSVHRSHVGAVTSSTRLLRSLRGRPPTSGAWSESVCDGPPENVVWKARSRGTTPEADGASAVHQGCGDKAARSPASGASQGAGRPAPGHAPRCGVHGEPSQRLSQSLSPPVALCMWASALPSAGAGAVQR